MADRYRRNPSAHFALHLSDAARLRMWQELFFPHLPQHLGVDCFTSPFASTLFPCAPSSGLRPCTGVSHVHPALRHSASRSCCRCFH
eukprot:1968548-Alexandrium_andersonii.AAC.1